VAEFQFWFNTGIGVGIPVVALLIRNAIEVRAMGVESILKADINRIQVELINEYLKQTEFRYHTEKMEELNTKRYADILGVTEKIFAKLDHKADKP